MLKTAKKISALLTTKDRQRMLWISCAILVMAFIEVIGVASIMPFMAVLASPELIESNRWLQWVYRLGAFGTAHTFLMFLGVSVLTILIFSNVFTALTTRGIVRFTRRLDCSLSSRLVADYVRRPYLFFVSRNSADLNKNILTEVSQVVSGVIFPSIEMSAKIVVSFFMVALLVAVEPMLAVVMVVFIGGIYSGLYAAVKHRIAKSGQIRVKMNRQRYQVTSELFGGIKEIMALGREADFTHRFSIAANSYAATQADFQMISQLPRYALETLVFGGLLFIILYYMAVRGSVANALPLMALYAMAGYRIMPAMQYVFRSVTQIRFYLPAVDILYNDFRSLELGHEDDKKEFVIKYDYGIELRCVDFKYPGAQSKALSNVSVVIPKNSTVAFVGSTGSGKTTLVDVILGLLEPISGSVMVDGKELDREHIRVWRNKIGYVPQHIFLADDTVERNIAFGISQDEISCEVVENAARIANIRDFVRGLEKGFNTVIGERGVRLSGGQRQRIGIARALYHDPDILIMDEGTSALDGMTEKAVMQAIDNLAHDKTIILIAHRLTTVRYCDQIYHLEGGRIVNSGTYDELMSSSAMFRAMAQAASTGLPLEVEAT